MAIEKREKTLAIFGKKIGIGRARKAVGALRTKKAEAQQTLEELDDLEVVFNGLYNALDETLDEIEKVCQLAQEVVKDARANAKARKVQLEKIFNEQD